MVRTAFTHQWQEAEGSYMPAKIKESVHSQLLSSKPSCTLARTFGWVNRWVALSSKQEYIAIQFQLYCEHRESNSWQPGYQVHTKRVFYNLSHSATNSEIINLIFIYSYFELILYNYKMFTDYEHYVYFVYYLRILYQHEIKFMLN